MHMLVSLHARTKSPSTHHHHRHATARSRTHTHTNSYNAQRCEINRPRSFRSVRTHGRTRQRPSWRAAHYAKTTKRPSVTRRAGPPALDAAVQPATSHEASRDPWARSPHGDCLELTPPPGRANSSCAMCAVVVVHRRIDIR